MSVVTLRKEEPAPTAAPVRDFGPRPELTWLPVDRLAVDAGYQRSTEQRASQRLIRRIAETFQWSAFQAILATPSGPESWLIIDGQHRVAAARLIGLSLVPAVVVHGIDRAGQAQAFVSANGNRLPVPPQAVFYARLLAGDPAASAVKRACDAAGIELLRYAIGVSKLPAGKTTAAPALLRILGRHGEARTAIAIAAITARFGKVPGALRAPFFEAAAEFLAAGGGPEGLDTALWQVLPEDLHDAASNASQGARIVAIVARLRAAEKKSGGGGLDSTAAVRRLTA